MTANVEGKVMCIVSQDTERIILVSLNVSYELNCRLYIWRYRLRTFVIYTTILMVGLVFEVTCLDAYIDTGRVYQQ